MKVLLTGFEAFDGDDTNPSQELVEGFDFDDEIEGLEISKIILPVSFDKCLSIATKESFLSNPHYIICFGLNAKAVSINLETTAKNIINARIPDNEGKQPQGEKVISGGDDTYESGLPLELFKSVLDESDISSSFSNDCGEYACNYLFYGLSHVVREKKMRAKVGFIHVPKYDVLSREEQQRALRVMLKKLVKLK